MYNHTIKSNVDGYFATAQAVPQNTSAYGDEGSKIVNATMGRIELVVVAKTDVAITANQTLTIEVYDSADDSSFAAIDSLKFTDIDAATTLEYAAGDEICRFALPSNTRKYVKPKFTTNDASASGTLDCYMEFFPA